mmetsp:Transcript_20296/g.38603  ORF Transcript_20296/g.38603 Transcript_20296/m.38603 type:complete len:219 (+) Transcript_20296:2364-3020(+)
MGVAQGRNVLEVKLPDGVDRAAQPVGVDDGGQLARGVTFPRAGGCKVSGQRVAVGGGGHEHQLQALVQALPHVHAHHRQQDVVEYGAVVNLVHHQVCARDDAAQELDHGDGGGLIHQARAVRVHFCGTSDSVPHLLAQLALAQLGDVLSERRGSDAAGLRAHDVLERQHVRVLQQHPGHASGLAPASASAHNHHRMSRDGLHQNVFVPVDGELSLARV